MVTVNRNTLLSKLLSITLSFVAIVSGFSLFGTQSAHAATVDREGTFDNIKWTLDTDGKLTLEPNEGTSATLSVALWGLLQIPIGNAPWLERVTNSDLPSQDAQYILDNTEEILIEEGIVLTGDCRQMFRGFTNMTSIVGIKLSNVTNISQMFASCEKLESINVSEWDMSTVTNASQLFSNCKALKNLDVSKWNTSKLSSMGHMFYECNSLEYLDVSNWSLDKAANINRMFYNCKSLNNLDTSKWEAPLLTSMEELFYGCASLEKVDVSGLNTENVKSLYNVFSNLGKNAGQAQIIGLDKFNTANVTNFSGIFSGCNVSEVDVSEWNTAKATIMASMFRGTKLSTLDLRSFDTGKVTSMSAMFAESDIADIKVDLNKWTTENVTNLGSMFHKSSITDDQFNALNIANWDTKNCTSFGSLFSYCQNLTKLDLSKWDTSKAPVGTSQVPIRNITFGCNNLEELDLSGWTCASDMGQLTCPTIKKVVLGSGYQANMFQHYGDFNLYNIKDPDNPVKLEPRKWFADSGTYVRGRKITYKANYGTAADQESYIFYSVDGNLKENTFSRQNYYFTGWNTAANGTGQAFSNKEAVDYDDERFTSDELTLYAQWKYDADYNRDGIRDRFQIFVYYESADWLQGEITGEEYEVKNANNYTELSEEADFTGVKTSGSQGTPRKGYMLHYWSFTPAGGTEQRSSDGVFALDDIKGDSDITITAVWAEDRNGNNTPDDEETRHSVTYKYAEGSPSNVPALPSALTDQLPDIEITVADNPDNIEGYVFDGWKVTSPASGTTISGGKFTMPNDDVVITGTWKVDKNNNGKADEDDVFTIIYYDEDGTTELAKEENKKDGETLNGHAPVDTNTDNRVFSGWNPTFNSTVAAEDDTDKDCIIKYTATWKEDRNNDGKADEEQYVTVTYKDGAEGAAFADVVITEVNGVKLIPGDATPAYPNGKPEREYYVFDAWTPSLADVLGDSDATYTATWKDDKNKDNVPDEDQPFTVTFNGNGKEFATNKPADQSVVYGNKATRPTEDPTAEKAIFDNWYKDQACSEAFAFDAEEITAGTTIWAGWFDDLNGDGRPDKDEDKYSIIYQYENAPPEGAWAPPLLPPTIWGVEITISGSPAPVAGYIFKGWRVTSPADLVVENGKFMMPKSDVTIIGPWVKKNFNDNIKDEEGNPITPKNPLPSDPEPKVGDRFEDENGDEYEITEVGPSDKDGNVPITVGQVMSLTFDLDGGTLQGQTGTFVVKEVKNRSFVIPNEEPTKKGYIFLYWEGSIYYPGDTYKVKDHHKFTAKWIKTAEVGNPNNDGNNSSIISDTENGSGSDAGDGSANKLSSGSKNKSVKTGDESNVALWIALMLISCLGAVGSISYHRRRG